MEEQNGDEEFTHWLMKSEPEPRFENGIDVKVSLYICLKRSSNSINYCMFIAVFFLTTTHFKQLTCILIFTDVLA